MFIRAHLSPVEHHVPLNLIFFQEAFVETSIADASISVMIVTYCFSDVTKPIVQSSQKIAV